MKRIGFIWLLIVAVLTLLPAVAWAHNATMTAVVTLDPPVARAGLAATVTVELVDAYYNDIPGAKVRAVLEAPNGTALVTAALAEASAGTYRGSLRLPGAGPAVFRLEANLPDGLYSVEFAMTIGAGAGQTGPDGTTLSGMTVGLTHEDAAAGAGQSTAPAPAPTPAPMKPQPAVPPVPAPAAAPASPAPAPAAAPVGAASGTGTGTPAPPAAAAPQPDAAGSAPQSKPPVATPLPAAAAPQLANPAAPMPQANPPAVRRSSPLVWVVAGVAVLLGCGLIWLKPRQAR